MKINVKCVTKDLFLFLKQEDAKHLVLKDTSSPNRKLVKTLKTSVNLAVTGVRFVMKNLSVMNVLKIYYIILTIILSVSKTVLPLLEKITIIPSLTSLLICAKFNQLIVQPVPLT